MTTQATTANPTTKKPRLSNQVLAGRNDARIWVHEAHPADVRLALRYVNTPLPVTTRAPWDGCHLLELQTRLRMEGRLYSIAFFNEAALQFRALARAQTFTRHQEGVEDGRRWANDFATADQLVRIQEVAGNYLLDDIFDRFRSYQSGSWTPAHVLVAAICGDEYPTDKYGDPDSNCEEFYDFWQPFVEEPLEPLLVKLNELECSIRHKLQESDYVIGFIDGALGLSERLQERFRRDGRFEPLGQTH